MKPKYAKRPPMLVMRGLVNDKLETRERIAVEAIVGGWGTTEHYQTLAAGGRVEQHDRCIHPSGPHPMHEWCEWRTPKTEGVTK